MLNISNIYQKLHLHSHTLHAETIPESQELQI